MNALRTSFLVVSLVLTACGPADAFVEGEDAQGANLSEELVAGGRFETFVGKDGQFYFHLLAGNGQRVLASEGYVTEAGASAGVESVKTNGTNPARYLEREAADGSHYFLVTAANGQVIARSQMYSTASNATRGEAAVQRVVATITGTSVAAQGATRFEVFKGLDNKYYFHLKADNGEVVLQSQGYSARTGANNGVASVKTNGGIAARYEVRAAADGQSYFVLKAANGATIGLSELYVSQANAQRGVQTVMGLLATVK